jgi:hypothetical protein
MTAQHVRAYTQVEMRRSTQTKDAAALIPASQPAHP